MHPFLLGIVRLLVVDLLRFVLVPESLCISTTGQVPRCPQATRQQTMWLVQLLSLHRITTELIKFYYG